MSKLLTLPTPHGRKDPHLLSWIICSLEPSLVSSMYGITTFHRAWNVLVSHLKRQLQSVQQGNKFYTEYLQLAKQWADQLAVVGNQWKMMISLLHYKWPESHFNSFIIAFSFVVRDTEMSFADFESELLSHETLLENQQLQTINPESSSYA